MGRESKAITQRKDCCSIAANSPIPASYELLRGFGGDSPVAAACAQGNVILRVNSDVTLGLVAVPNTG